MLFGSPRRAVALVLALVVGASPTLAVTPPATSPASLGGRVLAADGKTPQPGVVIALVDEAAQKLYRSQPTAGTGGFSIESVPAGTYSLVAETPKGAYLAARSLTLAPGGNTPLALTLQPTDPTEPTEPTTPPPTEPATTTTTTSQTVKLLPWQKWVLIGAIGVTALVVVDQLTDDEDEPQASPF